MTAVRPWCIPERPLSERIVDARAALARIDPFDSVGMALVKTVLEACAELRRTERPVDHEAAVAALDRLAAYTPPRPA